LVAASSLFVGALAGCGSSHLVRQHTTDGPASSGTASSAAVSATPVPTPPFNCTGAVDYESVLHLVATGMAVALAKATVTGKPEVETAITGVVPVSNVEVLAGSQPNGPINYIQEPMTGGANLLPEGDYLLLLGAFEDEPSTYYLAAGIQGSFVVNDNQADERCPNCNDPSNPVLAGETVPIDKLTVNFVKAIDEYWATPLPRASNDPTTPPLSSNSTTSAPPNSPRTRSPECRPE